MKKEKVPSLQEALEELRKNFSTLIESQASMAILMKARHEALVRAGFTEEQALDIIKARGMTP